MAESVGRYLPALHRQFLDVTDPGASPSLAPDHLKTLELAIGRTILAERYLNSDRMNTLRALANLAIVKFAQEPETPSGPQVLSQPDNVVEQ